MRRLISSRPTRFSVLLSVFLLPLHVDASPPAQNPAQATAKPSGPVSYFKGIQPILQRSCQGCHQPATKSGDLLLTTYEGFMAGGAKGKVIIPGQPESSLIIG